MGSPVSIRLKYETGEIYLNSSGDGMEFPNFLARALDKSRVDWGDDEFTAHNIIIYIYKEYPYTLGVNIMEVEGEYPTITVDLHTRMIWFEDNPSHMYSFERFIEKYKEE